MWYVCGLCERVRLILGGGLAWAQSAVGEESTARPRQPLP